MISERQFINEWDGMESAFNITHKTKVTDWWFKELEESCDYEPYKETVRQLIYSLKFFPKPVEFRTQYNIVVHEMYGVKELKTCGFCFDGMIRFKSKDDDYGSVAFCSKCYPNRKGAVNPHYVRVEDWESDPDKYNRPDSPLPKDEAKRLIRDIIEVVDKVGRRFGKHEPKGPHKQMEEQRRQENIKRVQNEMDYQEAG